MLEVEDQECFNKKVQKDSLYTNMKSRNQMEDQKNDLKNAEAWRCKIQMYVIKGFIRPCNLWWKGGDEKNICWSFFIFGTRRGEGVWESL